MENIFYLNLNLIPYEQAWNLQKQLVALKKEREFHDFLILLEHPPTFTLGRWGREENLRVSQDLLKEKGIPLIRCERGGDITCHGPGQLVGYPILNLKKMGLGVKDYVTLIEEVVLRSLSDWEIAASRKKGFPGVWVNGQKIASIGIAVQKGIAFHGFALNCALNQPWFEWITPCGLDGVKMVSLQEITGQTIDLTQVRDLIAFHFGEIFNVQLNPIEEKDLQALLTTQVDNQPLAIRCSESEIPPSPDSEYRTSNAFPWTPNFELQTISSAIRNPQSAIEKKPSWLKKKIPFGQTILKLQGLIQEGKLHTVCQEARCPNQGECFSKGTATFLLMGSRCTRNCLFCAVAPGLPEPLNHQEPEQVAETINKLHLAYAVLTSVTRDDLPDGGAVHFVKTLEAIGRISPETKTECLIPDFQGSEPALAMMAKAAPCVLNHNMETINRLYPSIRPDADYNRSLKVLKFFKQNHPRILTKSGFMVGLGETKEEVRVLLLDLLDQGCNMVTIGQYLQPSSAHYPVRRFVRPEEFKQWEEEALTIGFAAVASGPFVRSSFNAQRLYQQAVLKSG